MLTDRVDTCPFMDWNFFSFLILRGPPIQDFCFLPDGTRPHFNRLPMTNFAPFMQMRPCHIWRCCELNCQCFHVQSSAQPELNKNRIVPLHEISRECACVLVSKWLPEWPPELTVHNAQHYSKWNWRKIMFPLAVASTVSKTPSKPAFPRRAAEISQFIVCHLFYENRAGKEPHPVVAHFYVVDSQSRPYLYFQAVCQAVSWAPAPQLEESPFESWFQLTDVA